jgi:hypothetical protein
VGNSNYKALIGSLVNLKVNHPVAIAHLVDHMQGELTKLADKLAITESKIEIYRLQGAIRIAKQHLELISQPQEIMYQIDKR